MWTKLGDEFPDEARDLSDAAFRTLTEAWCWSNRRLLDLVIDQRDLKRFAETENPEAAVEELIETGWWQDLGDGRWFIGCRFSEWQRDRSQVEHRREQLAQAQKRRRRHLVGDHSLCLNCKASDESTDDAADDYGDDPGRDGTGRVRNSNYATEEKKNTSSSREFPQVTASEKFGQTSSTLGKFGRGDAEVERHVTPELGVTAKPGQDVPNRDISKRDISILDDPDSGPLDISATTEPCRGCKVPKERWILASRDGYCITCYQTARLESA